LSIIGAIEKEVKKNMYFDNSNIKLDGACDCESAYRRARVTSRAYTTVIHTSASDDINKSC